MVESDIERICCNKLKKLGYYCIKLTSEKGIPDRLIIGKNRIFFIEFKYGKGKLAAHQKLWKKRLNKKGFDVLVAYCWNDIAQYLNL